MSSSGQGEGSLREETLLCVLFRNRAEEVSDMVSGNRVSVAVCWIQHFGEMGSTLVTCTVIYVIDLGYSTRMYTILVQLKLS
jgi:hypothetical protein